jgi:hypothetical protein
MSNQDNGQDQYAQFRDALDRLERVETGGDMEIADATDANPIQKFCQVWPKVRGVLEMILLIPIIPGPAKTVLRQFILLANGICGV